MNIPEEVKVAIQALHNEGITDRDECLQRLGSGSYEGAWANDINAADWDQFVLDCIVPHLDDKKPTLEDDSANVITTEVKLDQETTPKHRGRPKKDLTSKE